MVLSVPPRKKRDVYKRQAKSIYYANTDGINVRANAVDTSDVLGQLGGGDKVYVISADSNGWYKIAYNNTTAYVSGKYLTKVSDIASYTTVSYTHLDVYKRQAMCRLSNSKRSPLLARALVSSS